MMLQLQRDADRHVSLTTWECARSSPGGAMPDGDWLPIAVPGTVASALAAAGRWTIDDPLDADADDWWFRTEFPRPETLGKCHLRFDGLATLAEVWLNDEPLLTSRNMFRGHRIDVTERLRDVNRVTV